jgi:CheY-like chemotaxis protein
MAIPRRIAAHRFPYSEPPPVATLAARTSLQSRIALEEPPPSVNPPSVAISGIQSRILIADETGSAGRLAHLLHGLGYWLTKMASCGTSALALAQDFRPSIVLVALDLPDMSARYIARRVRERTGTGEVRLIALTDDHSLASRDRVCESGLLRYLSKPVSTAALQQALRAGASWAS